MSSIVEMGTRWLFGADRYSFSTAISSVDEDVAVIHEGSILFLYTGLVWTEGHWRLVWRDDLESQAMLLRFRSSADRQPVPGKRACILLSTVRTLVPIEVHEVTARIVPGKKKSPAADVTPRAHGVKYRFALETLDGETLMLATTSELERFKWLTVLYTQLVSNDHVD